MTTEWHRDAIMNSTATANKTLEDNGGLAGSGVVGSAFMLSGFRAVPQLWRWAAQP